MATITACLVVMAGGAARRNGGAIVTQSDRIRLSQLMMKLIASDGEKHPDELALLERMMRRFNLTPSQRLEVEQYSEHLSLDDLAASFKDSHQRSDVFAELVQLVLADNGLAEEERTFLHQVGGHLSMDIRTVDRILGSVIMAKGRRKGPTRDQI